MINPNTSHQLTAMHMLSPDGTSHTFDERANGYGRGDGIGAMVVKRLSDAIRDGDTIRAVIRGSGVNADGKTPSVTQPSSTAQAELITQTYQDAGLDMSETGYFECHGTGTPVGDPLELSAIASTLGAARLQAGKPALQIGSIKPSVGHTEGCAGLAGVFKSILLLEKGMLVPTYGVRQTNPALKFSDWHLTLPESVTSWPTAGLRRISVNSFGFGGANAHVILDDAYHYFQERGLVGRHNTSLNQSDSGSCFENSKSLEACKTSNKLFVFSGKDQDGVKRVASALKDWVQHRLEDSNSQSLLKNLAFTLAKRRTHLEHRTFAIASLPSDLTESLTSGLPAAARAQRHGDNLVLVFTGQGAQWPSMGRELFMNPVFRQSIDLSQQRLAELGCKWNAIEELTKDPNPNVNRPEFSQPLCTIIQTALVDLLRSWQVFPKATIGHSSGEIAAAYAASLLTRNDAIKLAYVRGISSAALSKQGAMMAAGISEYDAQSYLETIAPGSAVVACVNSPSSVTLSGDVDAIEQLEARISSDGKFARKLKVTTAYHSPHMQEVAPTYLELIGEIIPRATEEGCSGVVMYSSLTGGMITSAKELDAHYWVDNMQNTVRFSQAMLSLLKHKTPAPGGTRAVAVQWGCFLEVGPHAALQGPVRQIIDASKNKSAKSAPYASMLVRNKDAMETSLRAAGVLWTAGCKVDIAAVNQQDVSMSKLDLQMLCDLPAYPWNHTRGFWHESYASRSYRFPPHVRSDFLGIAEDCQNAHEPRWRNYLRVSENPWIEDHKITDTVLYPGAGMLVMALEGALRTSDTSKIVEGFRMTNVTFERGLVISMDEESPVETRISFHRHSAQLGSWDFTVYSMANGSAWAKHCAGIITVEYATEISEVEENTVDALWQRQLLVRNSLLFDAGSKSVDVENFYDKLDTIGMQYGQSFRNVKSLTAVPSQEASYGTVAVPDTQATMPRNFESPHVIHPATMDSIFHLVIASLDAGQPIKQAAVPYSIDEIYVAHDQLHGACAIYSGYGRLLSQNGHEINTELVVSDQEWTKPKLTVKNFALRQVTSGVELESSNAAASDNPMKKCVGLTWTPDLSFVTSSEQLAQLISPGKASSVIDRLLDSVILKSSSVTAFIALFDESQESIEILHCFRSRTYGPRNIVALAPSEASLHLLRDGLGDSNEKTEITYKSLPENELLEMLAPEANDVFIGLGVSDIAKHAAKLATMAPVTCLTHAGQPPDGEVTVPNSNTIGYLAADGVYVHFKSSITPTTVNLPDSVVLLLPESPSDPLRSFAASIQSKLEGSTTTVTQTRLVSGSAVSLMGKHVISLLEIDDPLVYSWTEEQFNAFKIVMSTAEHVFWIAHGSLLESWSSGTEFATTQGLLRVMRSEYPTTTLPSLDLSAVADIGHGRYADLVLDVWNASRLEDAEMEYAESNGLVHFVRATEQPAFDHELQLGGNTAEPVVSALGADCKPQKALESLHSQEYIWTVDEQAYEPLESSQIEIKVEFAGIQPGHGLDSVRHAVGVVTRQNDPTNFLESGQRAIVFSNAAAKTHLRQTRDFVVPLPDGLEPYKAAALVEPLVTAHYALTEISHISNGQTLLLDSAASAVGQSVVQVAKASGAEIFALVHTRAERDILTGQYGIAADHIFDAAFNSFETLIRTTKQGRGIDVVICLQADRHVAGAMSTLSDFGHFIDINATVSQDLLPPSMSNVTFTRFDMATVIRDRPAVVSRLFQQAFSNLALVGPSPLAVVSAGSLRTEATYNTAKHLVVSLKDADLVCKPPIPAEKLELDSGATYVLAGGLGALGLDVANWMVDHGARHLVFLSRSGGAKKEKDLQTFEKRSVRAEAFKCNVNDAVSVAHVFDSLRAQGRRIAGVIQLAMVLEDGIFDNMSFDQWRRAIEPKTKGSRNLLANIWPGDKPSFILLSSITGIIGNTAQANYAAGNTFEDALAQHARSHLGINATSIDVGLVSDSAHFTAAGEFGDLSSYLGRYQHGWRGLQTNLDELGIVMRAVMRGSTSIDGESLPAQIVLGLGDGIRRADASVSSFSRDRKFELRVVKSGGVVGEGESAIEDVGTLIANASSMAEAVAAVEENIKDLVAAAMGVSSSEIDAQRPLYDYGGKLSRDPALAQVNADMSYLTHFKPLKSAIAPRRA